MCVCLCDRCWESHNCLLYPSTFAHDFCVCADYLLTCGLNERAQPTR